MHSLLPWILDDAEAAVERPWAVAESGRDVAVQTKTHKLIVVRDGGALSLFDLEADPGEQRNVARERREDLARLRGYLEVWQQGLDPVGPLESELTEETVEGLRALGYLD